MLMRCLDNLIRHVVIGWHVSDIAFTNRGVRRRRRNYFMGPGAARTRHGAPRRVKDIAFTNRGVRRRCRNYFMGAARARSCARGAEVWRFLRGAGVERFARNADVWRISRAVRRCAARRYGGLLDYRILSLTNSSIMYSDSFGNLF